jgi:predicted RNase H-like HicB family nuclease
MKTDILSPQCRRRGCHTQTKSLHALMTRVKEALELCLEVEKPISKEFVGVQKVAIN